MFTFVKEKAHSQLTKVLQQPSATATGAVSQRLMPNQLILLLSQSETYHTK